jgi:NADPH:quinone reductase
LKAVEIQTFGSPEGLAVIDLPDPAPADGQVLIATEAIGVGGVDAGADMPSFFTKLNPNGRMVAVGAVAGQPPADFGTKMIAAFQKSISFATFIAATVPGPDRRAVRTGQFAAASRGELQMVVHELLPLEQAVLAHQKMDAGEVFGRIVLTPKPSHLSQSTPAPIPAR